MQGTVASYDEEQRSGTVLLDDGTRLGFGPAALAGTGLRLLRPGQRVRVDGSADHVERVQLLTLP